MPVRPPMPALVGDRADRPLLLLGREDRALRPGGADPRSRRAARAIVCELAPRRGRWRIRRGQDRKGRKHNARQRRKRRMFDPSRAGLFSVRKARRGRARNVRQRLGGRGPAPRSQAAARLAWAFGGATSRRRGISARFQGPQTRQAGYGVEWLRRRGSGPPLQPGMGLRLADATAKCEFDAEGLLPVTAGCRPSLFASPFQADRRMRSGEPALPADRGRAASRGGAQKRAPAGRRGTVHNCARSRPAGLKRHLQRSAMSVPPLSGSRTIGTMRVFGIHLRCGVFRSANS